MILWTPSHFQLTVVDPALVYMEIDQQKSPRSRDQLDQRHINPDEWGGGSDAHCLQAEQGTTDKGGWFPYGWFVCVWLCPLSSPLITMHIVSCSCSSNHYCFNGWIVSYLWCILATAFNNVAVGSLTSLPPIYTFMFHSCSHGVAKVSSCH